MSRFKRFDPKQITKYFKDQQKGNIYSYSKDQKFKDDYFPPNENSIFSKNSNGEFVDKIEGESLYQEYCQDGELREAKMKSVTDIESGWVLYENGIKSDDVVQQGLGDCYFLATIASLTKYPGVIEDKFRNEFNEGGYYEIVLFIDGQWQVIILDDFIPVSFNGFVFAKPNGKELWACLLEKAWAKVNGGYTNIIGGTSKDPLLALTGFNTVELVYSPEIEDKIYKELLRGSSKNNVMCCTTQKDDDDDGDLGYNLAAEHEYSLLEAKAYKEDVVCLIKLRNPWGAQTGALVTEWTGDWSDNSNLWTKEYKEYFGFENKNDGVFFMSKESFFKYCKHTEICTFFENSLNINMLINSQDLLKPALVFNFKLTKDSIYTTVGSLFKNRRYNRNFGENVFHPCQVFIARYESDGTIKECFSDGEFDEDLIISEDLKAGNYVIWAYIDYDFSIQNDPSFFYTFFIRTDDKNMELQYVGVDEDFELLEKLVIARHATLYPDNWNSKISDKKYFGTVRSNDGQISYIIALNNQADAAKLSYEIEETKELKLLYPLINDSENGKKKFDLICNKGEPRCIAGMLTDGSTKKFDDYKLFGATKPVQSKDISRFFSQNIQTNLSGIPHEIYTIDKK